ncbi:hypothetical protein VTN96DRAFT_9392 [Rasamsonia emersonii]
MPAWPVLLCRPRCYLVGIAYLHLRSHRRISQPPTAGLCSRVLISARPSKEHYPSCSLALTPCDSQCVRVRRAITMVHMPLCNWADDVLLPWYEPMIARPLNY